MSTEHLNETAKLVERVTDLYKLPVPATRSGPLFNAFPYPTKISPEAIALFIATHTNPGDTVFDGFAGSGSTGLGAMLCANPSEALKQEAKRLGIAPQWGPRKAVLCEIGVLPSLIASVLTSPPEPQEFRRAAEQILQRVEATSSWLYDAVGPSGDAGSIRYTVWSDVLDCPACLEPVSLWDACVSREPATISSTFNCPLCGHETRIDQVKRRTDQVNDDLLGQPHLVRRRVPAWVYGTTAGKTWSRKPERPDLQLLERINGQPIPGAVPRLRIPWGDLHRTGYHEGISHLHHLYTRRNLIALGRLWAETEACKEPLKSALQLWLLGYNTAHATIMTRVVAKKGQDDLVVTSAEPGVMYVSGLPVEKNLFSGLRRKLDTICQAFELTHNKGDLVTVVNASSLSVNLPDASIDYVFTDPPFGGNIPYSEVNFVNEAWLGRFTDSTEEAIISNHQGKAIEHYQDLLARSFREIYRLLKPQGLTTVVFHSTSAQVWNALRAACTDSGFRVANTSVLDKTQGSFKQVTTAGAVRGDPLLLLTKDAAQRTQNAEMIWTVVDQLQSEAAISGSSCEATPQRLYSRMIAYYLERHMDVPIDAGRFFTELAEREAGNGSRTKSR